MIECIKFQSHSCLSYVRLNERASDIPAHLVSLLECGTTGDFADLAYAAGEHRAGQCAAWEAVHPDPINFFLRSRPHALRYWSKNAFSFSNGITSI